MPSKRKIAGSRHRKKVPLTPVERLAKEHATAVKMVKQMGKVHKASPSSWTKGMLRYWREREETLKLMIDKG